MKKEKDNKEDFTDSSRRDFFRMLFGAGVGLALGETFFSSCERKPLKKNMIQTERRTLVLGFDGMDPKLLAEFLKTEKFPNLKKLIDVNGIRELRTSNPPQSPVAWANFITGTNPGGHALFDFIHRDPKTYMPYLSIAKTHDPEKTLKVGKHILPMKAGKVEYLRKGTAFWELLEKRGVPSTVYRMPSNFPPVKAGRSISGMGTPDLLGGYGSFTFFTETPLKQMNVTGGEIVLIKPSEGSFKCNIKGPTNTFLIEGSNTMADVTMWKDKVNKTVKIQTGDSEFLLKEGDWSGWVNLTFDLLPAVSSVSGNVMFYVKKTHPYLQVYVTPVNIDPSDPALPISNPENYSKELAAKFGPFYTTGIPEDTKALDHDILSDEEYVHQNSLFYWTVGQIYRYELERFKSGFMFYYFSNTDLGSHMFWSAHDKKHPQYPNRSAFAKGMLPKIYGDMDRILGIAMEKMNKDDTIIVMSDHGFAPFYTSFHLNTWLKENGYLGVLDESARDESEFLLNVDWNRTRAYSIGFNSLYINQDGREGQGIVKDGPRKKALLEELRAKLLAAVDPKSGVNPISHVYFASEVYTGDFTSLAPDIIVGYNRGYRASWETAIGRVPHEIFSVNDQKWSGDHCVDPIHVPGIVLSNKKIKIPDPALFDIPVTVLAEFGMQKIPAMVGRKLF